MKTKISIVRLNRNNGWVLDGTAFILDEDLICDELEDQMSQGGNVRFVEVLGG